MIDDPLMDDFVDLSVILTGLAKEKLDSSSSNIKQFYLEKVKQKKIELEKLLMQYKVLRAEGKSDEEIGHAILDSTDIQISATARAIIKMWYLGSWYDFNDQGNEIPGKDEVISREAYQEGWVWPIMQAHPMGYYLPGSARWDKEPPPLSQFIGEK